MSKARLTELVLAVVCLASGAFTLTVAIRAHMTILAYLAAGALIGLGLGVLADSDEEERHV